MFTPEERVELLQRTMYIKRQRLKEEAETARLSIPVNTRIPLGAGTAFLVGMSLGMAHGSKMAGLRFRAEHAHKLPTTTTGWYMYHKSKNYHVTKGGVREGVKMGAKVSIWTTSIFAIEHMFDMYRGTTDMLNTVVSCVTVAGVFSLWNQFSLPVAARTTRTALTVGVVYGGLQDLVSLAKGRKISYVEFAKRKFGKPSAPGDDAKAAPA